jgi:hypothetical protein
VIVTAIWRWIEGRRTTQVPASNRR